MSKKIVILTILAIMAPAIVFAQANTVGDLTTKHNDFSISGCFINMQPMNSYIAGLGVFPGSFGDMIWLFNYAQKNQMDDKTLWGLKFSTTLTGLAVLDPNFLKREISLGTTNKAEFSVTMVQFTTEYQVVKFGPISVNAGLGFGIGGSKLTLIGDKSARFWNVSLLISPQASINYHVLEESGSGAILWFSTAYNYIPPSGWTQDGGSLKIPPIMDLSSLALEVGVTFPFNTK